MLGKYTARLDRPTPLKSELKSRKLLIVLRATFLWPGKLHTICARCLDREKWKRRETGRQRVTRDRGERQARRHGSGVGGCGGQRLGGEKVGGGGEQTR